MSALEVSKLKSVLQSTVNDLGEVGSVSSATVIEAVRKSDPDLIERASRYLEDGMMHRLLSQLAIRRPSNGDQAELFGEYTGLHQFIGIEVDRDGQRVTEWKPLGKVTLRELGIWLSKVRKTSRTRRQRNPGMARLLRDLSKAAKGPLDITVETAIAMTEARQSKKTAS